MSHTERIHEDEEDLENLKSQIDQIAQLKEDYQSQKYKFYCNKLENSQSLLVGLNPFHFEERFYLVEKHSHFTFSLYLVNTN